MATRAPVNVTPFQPIVDLALVAFATDFGYLEAMLQTAAGISQKREVWSYRTEAREAEALAQEICKATQEPCQSLSPCGFGDCPYASTENAKIVIVSVRGDDRRPVPASYPNYTRETVVATVRARVTQRTVAA